ncbi:MAG: phtD [Gammaproteobacteria bacterium]|jgi:MFS family permease|nr:phtD [Gammaproteobacteria bacterium]
MTKSRPYKLLAWFSCIIVALYFSYEMMQLTLLNTVHAELIRLYQINEMQLSFLASAYLYSCAASVIPAGILFDRWALKPLLLFTLFLAIVGTFLMAMTQNIWLAIMARGLIGIGNGFALLGYLKLVSNYFSGKGAALAKSFIYVAGMLGCILSQQPFLYATNRFGLRASLFGLGMLGIIIWVFMASILKTQPRAVNTLSAKQISLWQNLKLAFVNQQNLSCGFYACIVNLPMVLLGALWGKAYLMTIHQLTAAKAGRIISLIFVGVMLGSPCLGYLAGKVKEQRYLMLLIAVLGGVVFLSLAYLPLNITMLRMLFLLLGVITAAQLLSYLMVAKISPREIEATSSSIISILVNAGGALYQLLFSWVLALFSMSETDPYNKTGFKYAFIIIALSFLLSGILAYYIREEADG